MKFTLAMYVPRNVSKQDVIADLRKVAKRLGQGTLTWNEYEEGGRFSPDTACNRFGTWNEAKAAAGLKVDRLHGLSDEEYFENIAGVWIKLGRQPRYKEMVKPLSKLTISAYEKRFGNWTIALKEFIKYANKVRAPKAGRLRIVSPTASTGMKHKTKRTISWSLRYRIMKRDGFKCRRCGVRPSPDSDAELEVDHIVPWSKGGETVESNLQTLCTRCNGGKGNRHRV